MFLFLFFPSILRRLHAENNFESAGALFTPDVNSSGNED